MRLSAVMVFGWLVSAFSLAAQERPIDITIHMGKSGLFPAVAHDHTIEALISSGTSPRVDFKVETAKMMVKADLKVDAKTQANIQKDMEEITLNVKQFPEISFRSSSVAKTAEAQWKV